MPPQRNPRPNPVSDIDRFLQEVDRLRRKAADETQPPPARQPQAPEARRYDEVAEVLPADPSPPPPVVARPRRPRRFDDVEVVTPVQPAPARQALPTAPPPVFPATSGLAAPPAPTTSTVATIALVATVAPVTAPKAAGQLRKGPTENAAKVAALLRGGNIRSVMILREILDGPLSRRRRR
jgi:hypothetical protein